MRESRAGKKYVLYLLRCGAWELQPAGKTDCTVSGEVEDILSSERKIPLITNPYLVIQCSAVPSGIGVVPGLIFWLITGAQEMLLMFVVPGGFLALVFLPVIPVLRIVTGGGLLTTFFYQQPGGST